MKKNVSSSYTNLPDLKKILLLMQLSCSLLLLTFLQVFCECPFADKLTLTEKAISWEKLFDLLEKKSTYTFLYKDNVAAPQRKDRCGSLDLTVPEILDNVFRNTKLSYRVLPTTWW